MEAVRTIIQAVAALFWFYFSHVFQFHRIHPDMSCGRLFPVGREHAGMTFVFDASFAQDFNRDLKHLEGIMRKCHRLCFDYSTILQSCQVIRWLTCLVAWVAPAWALPAGALQFLVAPFSFPISVMKLFTYAIEAILHYGFALLLGLFIGGTGPAFTIGPRFLVFFLGVDQLVNLAVYLLWSEPFPLRRLLHHVVYGTANTKLYYFIAFGCLRGLQVDVPLLVLTSLLTVAVDRFLMKDIQRALGLPDRQVRFYMDHRLGHLPVAYQHAHKMHHHLHDSTAWDAHVYGNGMNENFFLLAMDVLPCMLLPSVFLVPYCFNVWPLLVTWSNKPHHTRLKPGTPYDYFMNFHADHHTYHVRNFSLMNGALLDFYFGTQGDRTKGTNGVLMTREERKGDGEAAGAAGEIVIKVSLPSKVADCKS